VTYEEFYDEVVRLYNDDEIDGELAVVRLAEEHPEHYERYCREEGLLDEEEEGE
jgi:hypothetical protein